MFSSLRLTTMGSHKSRARPGSIATSANSDSPRMEDTLAQIQYHSHSFLLSNDQEAINVIGLSSPFSVLRKSRK
ncbi:hypothetical protein ACS0PU_012435 [Formica fusca]